MTPLVVGVGNALRGDDGVGPAVAELARRDPRLAGARVLTVVQLTPELAADVAEASTVVVVDASAASPPGHVECVVGAPAADARPPVLGHHLAVGALLRLAATAFGRVPPAFVVSVGAAGFDAGAPLSPAVAAALARAVDAVAALVGATAGQPSSVVG